MPIVGSGQVRYNQIWKYYNALRLTNVVLCSLETNPVLYNMKKVLLLQDNI